MAEIAAAAFAAIGSAVGGTAAASTAAVTAGLAGPASAVGAGIGASTWFSALQLGLAGLGAVSTLAAGNEKSESLKAQAADADLAASNELIVGGERRSSLRAQAAQKIAERQAAYAAGGVDLSFGTPQTAQAQDVADTERGLAIDQGTEDQNRARFAERAGQFRRAAKSARSAATIKAFTSGAEAVLGVERRG
jgi:hypothetical protein